MGVWAWVKKTVGNIVCGEDLCDEDRYNRHFFWADPMSPNRCRECGQHREHYQHKWEG